MRLLGGEGSWLPEVDDGEVVIAATRAELVLLAGSLNEALEAVEGWEFDTRLGGSPDDARALRSKIKDLGIVKSNGREHFRGYLTFPVIDQAGNVGEVYGRKVAREDSRTGSPKHLYLPGPHRGVWNPAASSGSELIVTESFSMTVGR